MSFKNTELAHEMLLKNSRSYHVGWIVK